MNGRWKVIDCNVYRSFINLIDDCCCRRFVTDSITEGEGEGAIVGEGTDSATHLGRTSLTRREGGIGDRYRFGTSGQGCGYVLIGRSRRGIDNGTSWRHFIDGEVNVDRSGGSDVVGNGNSFLGCLCIYPLVGIWQNSRPS